MFFQMFIHKNTFIKLLYIDLSRLRRWKAAPCEIELRFDYMTVI